MLHLRRLIRISKSHPTSGSLAEPNVTVYPHLVPLPVELWVLIFSHIDNKRDLSALSWTSRLLRALALPLLFQSVDLLHPARIHSRKQLQTRFKILKPLGTPGLAAIVIELHVTLSAWEMCEKQTAPRSIFRNSPKCTCDALDNQVGECMKAMVNLEVLHVHCVLCDGAGRHHYMADLETRKLRNLYFWCYCDVTNRQTERLFSSPIQATIQALRWRWCSYTVEPMIRVTQKLLDAPQTLPSLNALFHGGTSLENILLASRPISRIFTAGLRESTCPGLIRAFKDSPGVLTHLVVQESSLVTQILAVKPDSFTNLQHIGTIHPFDGDEILTLTEVVELFLSPLQSLNHLVSMDAIVFDDDPWNVDLLSRIKSLHQGLRKVFVQGGNCCIWELRGLHWEKREVNQFWAWDIIRGACDDI